MRIKNCNACGKGRWTRLDAADFMCKGCKRKRGAFRKNTPTQREKSYGRTVTVVSTPKVAKPQKKSHGKKRNGGREE